MMPPKYPPGYENMKNSKTYSMQAVCKNCGYKQTVEIEKGKHISSGLFNHLCNKCNCETLKIVKDDYE